MRDQGFEALYLAERKKVSMKVTGKDEGAEGRRRLSGGGYGGSYGGGKTTLANNHTSSMGAVMGLGLKGGSALPSRHHSHPLLSENFSVMKEVVVGEGDTLNKKKVADDESALPHWGHGKRSRCSRVEPFKSGIPVSDPVCKSTPRSVKSTQLPPGPRIRPSQKVTCNKTISNGVLPRSNPVHRISNGLTSNSLLSLAARQHGGDARERLTQKEKAMAVAQPKNASANHRQLQGSDASELATTTQCHVHANGDMTTGLSTTKGNNSSGPCNGHSSKITHSNLATCVLASEPTAPAAKLRVDLETLEWPRIVIALSRKEKEDDFLVFKGTKLPQRPRKRPRVVEKAIHYCTPGNWLIDLSRGRYDVREKKSCKKKPRGLKAMESLDSDSE